MRLGLLIVVAALLCLAALAAGNEAPASGGAAHDAKSSKEAPQGTGGVRGARQGITSSLVPNNGSIVATSSEVYLPTTGTYSSVDTNKAIIAGVLSVGLLTVCFLGLALLVCYISWKTGGAQGDKWIGMEPPAKPKDAFTQDSPLFKPLITENQNPLFTSQRTL